MIDEENLLAFCFWISWSYGLHVEGVEAKIYKWTTHHRHELMKYKTT